MKVNMKNMVNHQAANSLDGIAVTLQFKILNFATLAQSSNLATVDGFRSFSLIITELKELAFEVKINN